MNSRESYLNLASEIEMVNELLNKVPENHVIERNSLQARLSNLNMHFENVHFQNFPRKAKLTFRGSPVLASHGISTDFAGMVAQRFTDAVKAIVAGLEGNLNYMGRLPGKECRDLLITGIARGSFGFEIEVSNDDHNESSSDLFDGLNETEFAIDKMQSLFEKSLAGDDDTLAELVDEIHPRAIKKTKEFLESVSERGATCAMEFNNRSFRFKNDDELKISIDRLSDNNIREDHRQLDGEIFGALPKSRTFEFKITGQDIIKGKIGLSIEDPDILNREYLHRVSTITVVETKVGQGRPRYVLNALPEIKE